MQFKSSDYLTLGLELELQIVNKENYDLQPSACDFMNAFEHPIYKKQIMPEITQSMLEMISSIHRHPSTLLAEMKEMRDALLETADSLNVHLLGGGTHHFQMWHDRQIYPNAHYKNAAKRYGYLAKMFTVFGMHIHIGCPTGDEALYLMNALLRFVPQFIALSAASPFCQGVDTGYDSSRSNVVNMFPLSGIPPFTSTWEEFVAWFDRAKKLNIVDRINNFYWDIRPKPDLGTIEIRVCDTPMTIERAVEIAAFAQTLSRYILIERPYASKAHDPLVYNFNRYESSYNSMDALITCAETMEPFSLKDDLLETLERLSFHATALNTTEYMASITRYVAEGRNDARLLRQCYRDGMTLEEIVAWQSGLFAA